MKLDWLKFNTVPEEKAQTELIDKFAKKSNNRVWIEMSEEIIRQWKKIIENDKKVVLATKGVVTKILCHNNKIYGNIYLEGKCYHTRILDRKFIEDNKIQDKVATAIQTGKLVSIQHGRSKTKQENRKEINMKNQNMPFIRYPQGKKNLCLQRSFTSALSYWKGKNVKIEDIYSNSMMEEVNKLINKMTQDEKKPLESLLEILRKANFSLERFPTTKRKRKKNKSGKEEANILLEEFSKNCVTICQICGGSSDTTHTVSITDNFFYLTVLLNMLYR